MPPVDFEQQAVLGLEVIGHAAGIGAGGLRDVADRNRIEAVGREQLLRGSEDRLAQIRLARRGFLPGGTTNHIICTYVQKIRSGQQGSAGDNVAPTFASRRGEYPSLAG